MEEDIIKFDDYCKILWHFEGKNTYYRQQFFMADGDPTKFNELADLEDEVIEQRLNWWSDQLNVEAKEHNELLGKKVPKIEELTTSQWVKIVDFVDSQEHPVLSFPIILHFLTGADVEDIKEHSHKKPAEIVSFFLSNLNSFIQDSQSCSKVPQMIQTNVKYQLTIQLLSTLYTRYQKVMRETLTQYSIGLLGKRSALEKLKSKLPKKLRKKLEKEIKNKLPK